MQRFAGFLPLSLDLALSLTADEPNVDDREQEQRHECDAGHGPHQLVSQGPSHRGCWNIPASRREFPPAGESVRCGVKSLRRYGVLDHGRRDMLDVANIGTRAHVGAL